MIEAIKARRSIRHFLPTPLSKEQLEEIVRAGMAAPSAKNLQPWHFVVTEGQAKERVCAAMEAGIERERHSPMLPDTRHYLDGAFETLRVMREAAAVILITSPIARPLSATMTLDQRRRSLPRDRGDRSRRAQSGERNNRHQEDNCFAGAAVF